MNEGKGFFLGVIAAVVLFVLWKKECSSRGFSDARSTHAFAAAPAANAGCGCGGPSAAASPAVQSSAEQGQVSPGTPPLQSSVGSGSFYADSGPTSDLSFTNVPAVPVSPVVTASPVNYGNVPGSPTTPANVVPVRAAQPVGSYSQIGFQQRYSVSGVPRVYIN